MRLRNLLKVRAWLATKLLRSEIVPSEQAAKYRLLGDEAFKAKKYDTSLEHYSKAVEVCEKMPQCWPALSRVLLWR